MISYDLKKTSHNNDTKISQNDDIHIRLSHDMKQLQIQTVCRHEPRNNAESILTGKIPPSR